MKSLKELTKKAQALNTGLFISVAVIVLVFVVIGLIMAFGAKITGDVGDDFDDNSYEKNITDASLEAQTTMAEYQNTWATIVAAAVIIIILIGAVLGTVLMLQNR